MRRWVPVLVLLAAAVFPASALADPPAQRHAGGGGGAAHDVHVAGSVTIPVTIPRGPTGGWLDATTAPDDPSPTCVGAQGFHSMWYTVSVTEASVLTVTLTSGDVHQVSADREHHRSDQSERQASTELGCGLGGNDSR